MPDHWATNPFTHGQHIRWLECGARAGRTLICDREPGHAGAHSATRFEPRNTNWMWWDSPRPAAP